MTKRRIHRMTQAAGKTGSLPTRPFAPARAATADSRPHRQAPVSLDHDFRRMAVLDTGLARPRPLLSGGSFAAPTSPARSSATPIQPTSAALDVFQLKPMKKAVTGTTHLVELVGGHLYREDFQANERDAVGEGDEVVIETDTRYRSRRGPNQEEFSATDKEGPPHYLWYLVTSLNQEKVTNNLFIREDTIINPAHEEAVAAPLSKTIYGTDGSTPKELADAYSEGTRDFDCAHSYHNGNTYQMFRSFPIDKGPVRLIYKFKLEESDDAAVELAKLSRTAGVILHTIMLHELPKSDDAISAAVETLALLSQTYHARLGVSNVGESGLKIGADLSSLQKALKLKDLELSVVENKMNPVVADKVVREYCERHGIQYLAYGVGGPSSSSVGTCGSVPGQGDGEYQLLSDPGLLELAKRLGMQPGDLRYVINTWARRKNVSVIARSSKQERRENAKTDVELSPETESFLDSYSESTGGIYTPYVRYLLNRGVGETIVKRLPDLIQPNWLEIYYKKVAVDLAEDPLLNLLVSDKEFAALSSAPRRNRWSDLTDMRGWLTQVITGTLFEDPAIATAGELVSFAKDSESKIYDSDYKEYETESKVSALAQGTVLTLPVANTPAITYKKLEDGRWERQ